MAYNRVITDTWTPKVCKIRAFMAFIIEIRAIVLHTFGGLGTPCGALA